MRNYERGSSVQAMSAAGAAELKSSAISIVLADDHEIVRDGIRMIIEAEEDMQVVAEVADADAARRRTSGLKPDVLVLDLNMPGAPSLAQIPAILESSPETAIVVLTMQDDPRLRPQGASDSGRGGSCSSTPRARSSIQAIRETVAGERFVNSAGRPASHVRRPPRRDPENQKSSA